MPFKDQHGDLKYILEKEQEIRSFLAKLVENGVITPEDQKQMNPTGSAPGILYGTQGGTGGASAPFSAHIVSYRHSILQIG